ncbi:potassium voltage-gated channel subfamily A member 2-like [Dendronephthya gigantea]|uniref:potassium voltage-gated channel subfamily A member 2-like n=1 Tax=Dendronephthya gigantea TaxID=151771 RepID=UPI00106BA0E6|nr:potassium voltage-gated channel subfamily A member 2-like [Dendronephthya gigantea]
MTDTPLLPNIEPNPLCPMITNTMNSNIENQIQPNQDAKIIINVSGLRFQTYVSTLEKFPDTLLGSAEKRQRFYDPELSELFFDRNRSAFEAILSYYQNDGCIFRPENVPVKIIAGEIIFFELGSVAMNQLFEIPGHTPAAETVLPKNKLQRRVWLLFEHPDSSVYARILAFFSLTVIMVSIVTFCLESMPMFSCQEDKCSNKKDEPWHSIEIVCIAWFTIEYLARLLSAPEKMKFIRSFLNIIDLVAILPYYITLPLDNATGGSFAVLRVFRLVRVFRIFKLSRHSKGLQILGQTLRASMRELGMLIFFMIIVVVLFSSAIYYAEGNNFSSIPGAFWWSVVTMTTVGYGDKYPKTWQGKLVGSICALSGVLTIALPVPVIVSNFTYFYQSEHEYREFEAMSDKWEENKEDTKELDGTADFCGVKVCNTPGAPCISEGYNELQQHSPKIESKKIEEIELAEVVVT